MHIDKERCSLRLVDYDWYAFCQAPHRGTEGEDRGEMHEAHKNTGRAAGAKKP